MRKFRAWDTKEKKMIYTFEEDNADSHKGTRYYGIDLDGIISYIDSYYICDDHELDFGTETNRFILMQFTGLKDKNKKEIYESDNVFAKLNGGFTGTVVYDRASFKIDCPNGRDINNRPYILLEQWCNVNYRTVEVIGNKYQNTAEVIK